jgi:hypothetical protein
MERQQRQEREERESRKSLVERVHDSSCGLPLTYEQVISGLHSLEARDFDLNYIDARGMERLAELTHALVVLPSPERAIPELSAVMERLPESDLGSPGPLVHTLEKLAGYEDKLVQSLRRRPTALSVWMVNRILNAELSDGGRKSYLALLEAAAEHPDATNTVRDDARNFLKFQSQKSDSET